MRIATTIRIGAFALSVATLAASVGTASASPWSATHPWRAQVNTRLAIQSGRIFLQRASGHISPVKAFVLHTEDRVVRHEERLMSKMNGGHLTPFEHHLLNKQENVISHQI